MHSQNESFTQDSCHSCRATAIVGNHMLKSTMHSRSSRWWRKTTWVPILRNIVGSASSARAGERTGLKDVRPAIVRTSRFGRIRNLADEPKRWAGKIPPPASCNLPLSTSQSKTGSPRGRSSGPGGARQANQTLCTRQPEPGPLQRCVRKSGLPSFLGTKSCRLPVRKPRYKFEAQSHGSNSHAIFDRLFESGDYSFENGSCHSKPCRRCRDKSCQHSHPDIQSVIYLGQDYQECIGTDLSIN